MHVSAHDQMMARSALLLKNRGRDPGIKDDPRRWRRATAEAEPKPMLTGLNSGNGWKDALPMDTMHTYPGGSGRLTTYNVDSGR
jgi:hypothetical protein